jgi:hypothetical protein
MCWTQPEQPALCARLCLARAVRCGAVLCCAAQTPARRQAWATFVCAPAPCCQEPAGHVLDCTTAASHTHRGCCVLCYSVHTPSALSLLAHATCMQLNFCSSSSCLQLFSASLLLQVVCSCPPSVCDVLQSHALNQSAAHTHFCC